ncbi:DUF6602 domain-containing protein [Bacillus toyonensis]|uniref:DUF6602 domain-containing protein n=1 Tax=Bacillus toyonensis TaxID=155322 RepID=UPI000BEFB5EB|nr:DUF6602 domain-containing protein [Bacillus toyonensis]PEM44326.1 hypothetical protein CN636_13120 [Bacillus toyonensis]
MNMIRYFSSISDELSSLKYRIRNLMDDPHWLTDGEWKESVLRNILRRYLPETIAVGRGFIYSPNRCSTQIDILLYDVSYPILFKDGDLVFVTPDAVRGIIEVKSNVTTQTLNVAFNKLVANARLINTSRPNAHNPCFTGLFSYETEIHDHNRLLQLLNKKCNGNLKNTITHVCLGESTFLRFWAKSPERIENIWHSYHLENLAPAYFITNLLETISSHSITLNANTWFPLDTKETQKTGSIKLFSEFINFDNSSE